jgi:hypothetical protein
MKEIDCGRRDVDVGIMIIWACSLALCWAEAEGGGPPFKAQQYFGRWKSKVTFAAHLEVLFSRRQ